MDCYLAHVRQTQQNSKRVFWNVFCGFNNNRVGKFHFFYGKKPPSVPLSTYYNNKG